MKKYQSIEAKRERIAELDELISGTEKGIRALEDYITRCDLAIAEGEEWDTEDARRILVKTYQAREEYRNERYTLIEELHDIATETAEALCTAYEETTNSPADYLAAYRVAREEVRGIRPATAEQHETVRAMVEAIAAAAAEEAAEAAAEARATGYDREIVADMVERIAQAVRDDIPTGPENYRPTYHRAELLAYLGEPDDYDVTAIEHDATAYDPATGRTVWAVDAETLAVIAERHQLQFYAPAF